MLFNLDFVKEVGAGRYLVRTLRRQFSKRVLRKDQRMRLPTGDTFDLPRTSQFATEAFITGGDVDWGSEALLFSLAPRSRAFMDIGANIGYYSHYMRPGVSNVYAFEPDPRMFELLRKGVIGHANISIFPIAVGNRSGKARFTMERGGEVSHLALPTERARATIEVDIVTVDSFVANNQIEVGVIKTDVEGFDLEVLQGARLTLRTQRPYVLSEIQPSAELSSLVNDVGYRVCAYLRDVRSRQKSFFILDGSLPANYAAKMLFLVPTEQVEAVAELATSLQG